jgi:hypothetical protein
MLYNAVKRVLQTRHSLKKGLKAIMAIEISVVHEATDELTEALNLLLPQLSGSQFINLNAQHQEATCKN